MTWPFKLEVYFVRVNLQCSYEFSYKFATQNEYPKFSTMPSIDTVSMLKSVAKVERLIARKIMNGAGI